MNYSKLIFEYIHAIGEVLGYKDNLSVFDITGDYAHNKDSSYYRVFTVGGLQFEVYHDMEAIGDPEEYYCYTIWETDFSIQTPEQVAHFLQYLGHNIHA